MMTSRQRERDWPMLHARATPGTTVKANKYTRWVWVLVRVSAETEYARKCGRGVFVVIGLSVGTRFKGFPELVALVSPTSLIRHPGFQRISTRR